jgi:uncharacterized protein YdhG (YjbR/CyaY superfamily)
MPKRPVAGSIDEYIADFPAETQAFLEELRSLVHEVAPGVTERISYAIPTFDLNGRYLVYIAGFKKHVGMYPVGALPERLSEEVALYQTGKGTLQFPLGQPLPTELIRRFVQARVAAVEGT